MGDELLPPPEEINIGLELYLTSTPPLFGRLRKTPEDFLVKEISERPLEDPEGLYAIASVTVRNWETNRLLRALSKSLGISQRAVGFAGTKDKRAVTSQLMSFKCSSKDLLEVKLKDVSISEITRSRKPLSIGDLYGNDFHITIREIDLPLDQGKEIAEKGLDTIVKTGGFPNFFGVQRFGSIRPITHLVGKEIIKGDFRSAVLTYICRPFEKEPKEHYDKRARLQTDLDFKEALTYYPREYIFERSMLHHLAVNPDDWIGALEQVPDNLKMMFVHAYQSFLFNRMVSERMRRGHQLNDPLEGDIVIPLNKRRIPDHHSYITVNSANVQEIKDLLLKGKAYISGLIIGKEGIFAGGEMGEIERKVVESEKVLPEDFDIFEVSRVSSRGIRREILAPVFDLKWRMREEAKKTKKKGSKDIPIYLELKFSLFRGCYATSFLRELMKGEILSY